MLINNTQLKQVNKSPHFTIPTNPQKNPPTSAMTPPNPARNHLPGAYKAAVGLKNQNPALKVMIAIGGWNEGGKKYSEMASSKQRREKFVASVVSFLQEHKFDGLDLDWEYPGGCSCGLLSDYYC